MRLFVTLLGIVLLLIGALTGGCSLVFTLIIFGPGGDGILPIWLLGFLVGIPSLWLGLRMLGVLGKRADPPSPPNPGDPSS
jgi:hypothetical protein